MAKIVASLLDFEIVTTHKMVDCARSCGNLVEEWVKRFQDGTEVRLGGICDECEKSDELEKRRLRVSRLAPAFLRDSDETLFPKTWEILKEWNGFGFVYLHGNTGKCKTRMAIAVLSKLILHNDEYAKMVDSTLGDKISARFRESVNAGFEYVESLSAYRGILLLDDFDKNSFTERAAHELWSVVDYRYRWNLPTFFTTQCDILSLSDIGGNDERKIGESMARRIYDSSREWILKVE